MLTISKKMFYLWAILLIVGQVMSAVAGYYQSESCLSSVKSNIEFKKAVSALIIQLNNTE